MQKRSARKLLFQKRFVVQMHMLTVDDPRGIV